MKRIFFMVQVWKNFQMQSQCLTRFYFKLNSLDSAFNRLSKAKKINAKQLHWQVLDWNTPAIDFYKKYGVTIDAEWLDCKLHFGK